jgi:hypothetical protein
MQQSTAAVKNWRTHITGSEWWANSRSWNWNGSTAWNIGTGKEADISLKNSKK